MVVITRWTEREREKERDRERERERERERAIEAEQRENAHTHARTHARKHACSSTDRELSLDHKHEAHKRVDAASAKRRDGASGPGPEIKLI